MKCSILFKGTEENLYSIFRQLGKSGGLPNRLIVAWYYLLAKWFNEPTLKLTFFYNTKNVKFEVVPTKLMEEFNLEDIVASVRYFLYSNRKVRKPHEYILAETKWHRRDIPFNLSK